MNELTNCYLVPTFVNMVDFKWLRKIPITYDEFSPYGLKRILRKKLNDLTNKKDEIEEIETSNIYDFIKKKRIWKSLNFKKH